MVAAMDPARGVGTRALVGTPFHIVRALGAGASSEVFEARGPLGEECAVKVLRSIHAGGGAEARRLLLEGRALAGLDHPHLVKVRGAGATAEGRPYLAMARLHGETLRERLDRTGKLPIARACGLLTGALAGLSAAHRAGIVHRDVKPSNIFLAEDAGAPGGERAVLLDFGIAKIEGDDPSEATTANHVLGTPRYLAPEQVLGGRVDARTDVYAMGLVLFEAIAGRGPYDAADAMASMRAHIDEEPHLLREFVGAPAPLEKAIHKALEKSPDKRWPSAAAFAAAITWALIAAKPSLAAASSLPGSCAP